MQKKKVHFNYIIMSELFLNITSENYDCVLRKNSFILASEPENETVIDQHDHGIQHNLLVTNLNTSVNIYFELHLATLILITVTILAE